MATAVGLNMKITADTAGIGRGMNRTEKALAGLKRSTDQAASALRGLVAIEVGKVLASGFQRAADAAIGMANRLRATIDETAKLAQRTGIAVEALQGFQIAAGLSGVNNFTEAISKLSVKIAQAGQGNKDVQQTLERLNLSFEQLEAMSPEDRFQAVAAAIQGLPNEMERAAAAVKLFEEGGIQLLPLFAQNLDEIQAKAERLGIVLSGDQTAAIEEMNDALSWVSKTFDGIIGQVTANLAPIVTSLAEEFLSFVEAFEGFGGGGTGIADALTEGLLDFAEYLAGVFDATLESFGSFGETMSAVARVFEFVTNTFVAVVETLRAAFNFFEMTGNFIAEIIGGLLEGLGSFVSSDLEAFGKQLRENANAAGRQNAREFTGALGNAGAAASAAVFGGSIAGASGDGPASRAVRSARDRFQNRNSPEADAEREARRVEQQAARQQAAAARAAQQEQDRVAKEAERVAQEQARIEEKRLQDIGRLNEQYAEKSTEIEASRLDTLSRANQNALEASDIRSGGISQFLALATGREDPAVAEARAQRQELEKISAEIRKLGGTVELVGAA